MKRAQKKGKGKRSTFVTAETMAETNRAWKISQGEVPVKVPGLWHETWIKLPKEGESKTIGFGNYRVKVSVKNGRLRKRVWKVKGEKR